MTDQVLELGAGMLSIVTAWMSVFLLYHVIKVGIQRRIWRGRWFDIPLSLQLAIAFLAVSSTTFWGICAIWIARKTHNGQLIVGPIGMFWIASGRLALVLAFLCAIRIVTKPMALRWPWLGALGTCGTYLLIWLLGVF